MSDSYVRFGFFGFYWVEVGIRKKQRSIKNSNINLSSFIENKVADNFHG